MVGFRISSTMAFFSLAEQNSRHRSTTLEANLWSERTRTLPSTCERTTERCSGFPCSMTCWIT